MTIRTDRIGLIVLGVCTLGVIVELVLWRGPLFFTLCGGVLLGAFLTVYGGSKASSIRRRVALAGALFAGITVTLTAAFEWRAHSWYSDHDALLRRLVEAGSTEANVRSALIGTPYIITPTERTVWGGHDVTKAWPMPESKAREIDAKVRQWPTTLVFDGNTVDFIYLDASGRMADYTSIDN